jgi:hypothetical protein
MLSTLQRVIQGMGGKVQIHIPFDDGDDELVLASLTWSVKRISVRFANAYGASGRNRWRRNV